MIASDWAECVCSDRMMWSVQDKTQSGNSSDGGVGPGKRFARSKLTPAADKLRAKNAEDLDMLDFLKRKGLVEKLYTKLVIDINGDQKDRRGLAHEAKAIDLAIVAKKDEALALELKELPQQCTAMLIKINDAQEALPTVTRQTLGRCETIANTFVEGVEGIRQSLAKNKITVNFMDREKNNPRKAYLANYHQISKVVVVVPTCVLSQVIVV